MAALRYSSVLLDAGDTLIGPRASFGAVYAEVLATLGVPLSAGDLEAGLRACWMDASRALASGVDRYGADPRGESGFWLRIVEGTLARVPGAPRDPALAARALEPLRDAFRDPARWQVFDDVVPALTALRSMGVRLAVVSNWDSRLPVLLERLGLAPHFDTVVVSHLEGIEKPHPELFLRAVERLDDTPSRALHVGDTPELDEAGARAAGVDSVLVDRRGRLDGRHGAVRDLAKLPALAREGLG